MKVVVTVISRQHKVLCRLTMLIGALALFLVAPCHLQEVVESFLPLLHYYIQGSIVHIMMLELVTTARSSTVYNLEFLPSKRCPPIAAV